MRLYRTLLCLAVAVAFAATSTAGASAQEIKAVGDVKSVSWGTDHVSVFVKATNNTVWHRKWDYGWGQWENLGGDIDGEPAVASWGRGHMALVARFRSDDRIYTRAFLGGQWGEWTPLPDKADVLNPVRMQGSPRIVSPAPGWLHVVSRGRDNRHYYYVHMDQGGWCCGSWQNLGGHVTGDPEVVSWGLGHVDVFHRGYDGLLWHTYQTSMGWSSIERLGSFGFDETPRGLTWGSNHIEIFVKGWDQSIGHIAYLPGYCGGWCPWEVLGHPVTDGVPEPVSMRWGHTAVYVHGTNHAIYDRWHQFGGWNNWWRVTPEWAIGTWTPPSPVSWMDGHITVSWRDPNGAVAYRTYYQPDNGWDSQKSLGRPGENVAPPPAPTAPRSKRWGIAENVDPGDWPECPGATWKQPNGWKLRSGLYRASIPWSAPPEGRQWVRVRRAIQCAKRNNEEVLLSIDYVNEKDPKDPIDPLDPNPSDRVILAPSVAEYSARVGRMVGQFGAWVDYWGVANEPNGRWLGRPQDRPRNVAPAFDTVTSVQLLAGYYKWLAGRVGAAKVVGPEFLDAYHALDSSNPLKLIGTVTGTESSVRTWVREYYAAGGRFGVAAGFHPYGGVDRHDPKSLDDYIGALPAGTKVWLTEIGAYFSKWNESPDDPVRSQDEPTQAGDVQYLVNYANARAATVQRIYYYHLNAGGNIGYHWDTGLLRHDTTRREAWWPWCRAIPEADCS
jgi:hypothetical protein